MLFYFFFLLFVCLMTSVIHDDHYFALVLFDTLNVIHFFFLENVIIYHLLTF